MLTASATPISSSSEQLTGMANAIRLLSADAVEAAKSGHPGMPLGMAEVATVLFTQALKYDASAPDWPDRDRFILSAGHGSMLLYSLLYLSGYEDMDLEQLRHFRQLGYRTAGHPEKGHAKGIETTTGPLGQGLANAVGFALAERRLNAEFGDDLVDHHSYVIAGDGCLMEGISQEAITLAGHLGLGKLIVIWDDNGISIDGETRLATSENTAQRFAAAGWQVERCDAHAPAEIAAALSAAKAETGRPSLIAARSTIGKGAPNQAGSAKVHGSPLGANEIAALRKALDWPHPPFEIPAPILTAWRAAGQRGALARQAWEARSAQHPQGATLQARLSGKLPAELDEKIAKQLAITAEEAPKLATRAASGKALELLLPATPGLIGGSADLSGSNVTKVAGASVLNAADYSGNYIHYGIREHAMAAAMNGLALHGGLIPYGGTFLVFSDYARPAIRLAALMQQRVIFVLTHDSIGLGEDGPTHQPVEHLAALRAIPGLLVLRPADAVETLECWQVALQAQRPSVLALSRQAVPTVRQDTQHNASARGAYLLRDTPEGHRDATLIATGTEVEIALDAQAQLAAEGIQAAVVSMPCFELFAEQPKAYRDSLLPAGGLRVGIEAGVETGWAQWLGDNGLFVGMQGFGASGPAATLYRHFGITAEAVAAGVRDALSGD